MTAVLTRDTDSAQQPTEPASRRRRRGFAPAASVYAAFFVLYASLGYVMYRGGYINPDASSRVANAGYTLMSRYPHLGAVGFVWNPLPSFVEIPLFKLTYSIHFVRSTGFVGAIQGALFMAGAVIQVRGIARDRHAGNIARWLAMAAFAFHPMVLLYGGQGMSEGAALFFLLWGCRHLLRWLRTGAPVNLMVCGIALALCYLTRIEAAIAVALTSVVVFAVSTRRNGADGGWRAGVPLGLFDAVVVSFLPLFAIAAWSVSGWLLVGSLFDSITSPYSNAAQVASLLSATSREALGFLGTKEKVAASLLGMQPLIFVALSMVVTRAVRQRSIDVLAPLTLFGGILVYQMSAIYTATTFGWFRFLITAVPLTVVALLTTATPPTRSDAARSGDEASAPFWLVPMLVAVLVTSIPSAWAAMLNPVVGREEFALRSVIWPDRYDRNDHWITWGDDLSSTTAQWLDEQNLPPGSVLADKFLIGRTWLASNNPRQFVIRSDYDFLDKLNTPLESGVHYIVVPNPTGLGELDAINVRYPAIWADGAGFATLVLSVSSPQGVPQYRIYRVDGSS